MGRILDRSGGGDLSGHWFKMRRCALQYDALVRLAEKTGRIEEEQLKILFPPPHPLPPHWFAPPPAPDGRRVLRVFGTILMSVAIGLAICFAVVAELGSTVTRLPLGTVKSHISRGAARLRETLAAYSGA